MPDTEAAAETAAAPPATPAKTKKAVKAKARTTKSHPKYKEMIAEAITALHERTGSSRQAIIKYIKANFNLGGGDKVIANNVKQSLKMRISSGDIVQTKGVGASGSFKLVAAGKSKAKATKSKTKKAKVKKPAAKTVKKTPKKSPKPKKTVKAKKVVKAKKPAKKTAKPKKAPAKKKVAKKPASKPKKAKK
ncbi:histone H1-delta-like [Octopus sinensis]|uniref:Histone H1-delta-like n=1 Tax=Octopus sinensis TaxID=2607531 RepID=A0A7E6EQB8_9MOLL|nr:histone H1-delta-like [Octopus sinensis]